ncbi:MAG: HEAT repeat domain-containing protein [Gammaproteobacteria bacterium]
MKLSGFSRRQQDPRAAAARRWRRDGFRGFLFLLARDVSIAGIVVAYVVFGSTLVSGQPALASRAEPELHVAFENGYLSVDARDVSLHDILEEVATQSGLALSTHGSLTERMTRSFTELELRVAIDRLLHGMSYALQYAPDSPSLPGRLWVMSRRDLEEDGDSQYADSVSGRTRQDLLDASASQRLETVAAFAERETGAFVFEIEPALDDASEAVRYEAIFALGETGGDSGAALLHHLLADPDVDVRAAAIDALADAGGEISVATLATALHDPDPALRENAVYALGDIGGAHAVELLDQASTDSDEFVREAVKDVLGDMAAQE